MTLQYSTECKNARLDAIETVIGTAPLLRVYDLTGAAPGSCEAAITGTVLATFQLPSDWLNSASGGEIESGTVWTDTSADASGTADFFRIYDNGGGSCYIQGSAGTDAFLTMQNYVIAAGQSLSINSFKIVSGNIASAYYVDATGGDDENDGLSPATAWQTIAKVNAASFVAGDQILFKRGETFAGKLTPTDSGEAGNPIVYGTYGSGDRPIIDGSADRAFEILASAASYLRIEYIDFSGCADGAAYQYAVYCNTDNVYWYDCIFRDAIGTTAGYGMGYCSYTATGAELYNITIDSCQAYNNAATGISIGSVDGTLGPHDCLITNCIAHNNGTTESLDHGIYVRHGVIIEYCTCYDNPLGGGLKVNNQGYDDSPYKPIVRYNKSYSNYHGLVLDNESTFVHNNLFYDNDYYALAISNSSNHSRVYFNTFVNSLVTLNGMVMISGAAISDVILKNNLFIQDAAVFNTNILRFNLTTPADWLVNNTMDYNIYYHTGLAASDIVYDGTDYYTFAEYQALGTEANGLHLAALPGFVTRYSDFHPANAGNLDGHDGIAIDGYETDLDGNTRADPPNIGCYEEESA